MSGGSYDLPYASLTKGSLAGAASRLITLRIRGDPATSASAMLASGGMVWVRPRPSILVTMSRNHLMESAYPPLVTRHIGAANDESDRLRTRFDAAEVHRPRFEALAVHGHKLLAIDSDEPVAQLVGYFGIFRTTICWHDCPLPLVLRPVNLLSDSKRRPRLPSAPHPWQALHAPARSRKSP